MPKALINDISMYYEIHGKGEPIIFIGGFSADHLIWSSLLPELTNHYQMVIFDNRGAGQTDVPSGPYSIEQMTNDVVGLCQYLKISKAHFVGNSMGGFILQMLLNLHPELIKSATICNSTYAAHTPFFYFAAAQLELLKAHAPITAILKAAWSWTFSYSFLSKPGMLDSLIKMALKHPHPFTNTGYEGQYAAIGTFDSRSWLNSIKVPTLVIGGRQDLIFSEDSVRVLADMIPNAQYYCFENCGHLPHIEHPKQFANIFTEFIQGLKAV